jgi:tetratricopeptide (TPR) repeat protein
MKVVDWPESALEDGVIRESVSQEGRVVLWVRGDRDDHFQYWERIGSVARSEVTVEGGLCSTPATAVRARQRVQGMLGKLFQRFHDGKKHRFALPGGETAEQCGERQSDLMLVWAEDQALDLDESRIQLIWPEAQQCRKLGVNLFLVGGLPGRQANVQAGAEQPLPAPEERPRQHAEAMLAAARQSGDRAREALALTDLGVIVLSEGDTPAAIAWLEQALALSRQLGDSAKECDVQGNLGLALLAARQPVQARQLFENTLAYARSTGDRLAEKIALERLGLAASSLGEFPRALALFDQALVLTRLVGDRQQEANLLWLQGIQHAELSQRDVAIAKAQDAVTLFKELGKPQASWYGAYLQKYRMGIYDSWPGSATSGVTVSSGMGPQSYLGGSIVATVVAAQANQGQPSNQPTTGPGLLRMALSATKALAQFAASGFKTAPPEIQRKRIQVCMACEHHTGLRCKVCGCFTNAKSRLLQESCPIGKWPA